MIEDSFADDYDPALIDDIWIYIRGKSDIPTIDLLVQELNVRMYYLQNMYEKEENLDMGRRSR